MKKTINKQDWTGKKGTYTYTKDTITINNLHFKLKKDKENGEPTILVLSKEHGYKEVFRLYKYKNLWYSSGAGIEREDKNPYNVVARIIWNTF